MDIFSIIVLILLIIIVLLLASINGSTKNTSNWLSWIMIDVESLRDKLAPFQNDSDNEDNANDHRKKTINNKIK